MDKEVRKNIIDSFQVDGGFIVYNREMLEKLFKAFEHYYLRFKFQYTKQSTLRIVLLPEIKTSFIVMILLVGNKLNFILAC